MNCYILDTNIWVALFYAADSCHEESLRIFDKILESNTKIYICPEIILETVNVFNRIKLVNVARNFINFINSNSNIVVQSLNYYDSFEKAFGWFMEAPSNLSLTDLCLAAISINHDIDFLTFDKKLKNFYHLKLKENI